jgi:hypothetical protein
MVRVTDSQELPGSVRTRRPRWFPARLRGRSGQAAGGAGRSGTCRGRVLEIGTGVGVGLAWLVHGLGARRDVEVVTVELDDQVQRTALSAPWPPWVRFESGDGAEVVASQRQSPIPAAVNSPVHRGSPSQNGQFGAASTLRRLSAGPIVWLAGGSEDRCPPMVPR